MNSNNNKISKVLNDSRCIFKLNNNRKKNHKKKSVRQMRASLNKFQLLKLRHFDKTRRQNQVLFHCAFGISSSETQFHVHFDDEWRDSIALASKCSFGVIGTRLSLSERKLIRDLHCWSIFRAFFTFWWFCIVRTMKYHRFFLTHCSRFDV